jgi:probable rRNA maturation factor
MLKLEFINEVDENIDGIFFEKICKVFYTILQERIDEYLLGRDGLIDFVLVDDKKIQEINKKYRDQDKSTDVISFAYLESGDIDESDTNIIVGDIFISSETTKKQADERGHSFEEELKVLFIHGLLHLFGFDHNTDSEEDEMESWAKKILEKS